MTHTPAAAVGKSERAEDRQRDTVVLMALAFTGTAVSLQQTVVLPLVPLLPSLLDTSSDNVTWLVTVTLLTGAVSLPIMSRLADMFGKRRIVLICLVVMALGSLLGSVTDTFALAVTARALQGVALALIPVGISLLRDQLPAHRVPLAVALMSATLAIGAGVGPPLGGVMAEQLDWRSTFWVIAILGVVLFLAVWLLVAESPVKSGGRFDVGGGVLVSLVLAALLLALSKGATWGWLSTPTVTCTGLGLLLMCLWVPYELRHPHPLVDLRIFTQPSVLTMNIASVLLGFAVLSNLILTPLQLQTPDGADAALQLDPLHTGLWMMPSAIFFGLAAPLAAWMIGRFGGQPTLVLGCLTMTAAYAGRFLLSDDLAQIVVGSVVVAGGTSLAYAAMPILVMQAVPVTDSASANGINTLLRYVGGAAASAALASFIVSATADTSAAADGTPLNHFCLVAAAASAVAALLAVALGLQRSDGAEPRLSPGPADGDAEASHPGPVASTCPR